MSKLHSSNSDNMGFMVSENQPETIKKMLEISKLPRPSKDIANDWPYIRYEQNLAAYYRAKAKEVVYHA